MLGSVTAIIAALITLFGAFLTVFGSCLIFIMS